MELSQRIVTKMPMDSIWTENEELKSERKEYLSQNQVSEILKEGPLQFLIADVGNKLIWTKVDECYKMYKSYFKDHILRDVNYINLDDYKDNFCYLASLWIGESKTPVILLEKFH
jgi:hypothetical protein